MPMSDDASELAPEAGNMRHLADERESCAPTRLISYFLRLGLLGFGGPVALANSMRLDLVEKWGWLEEHEYDEGLAIATACPGPLAYQLAVYCALSGSA